MQAWDSFIWMTGVIMLVLDELVVTPIILIKKKVVTPIISYIIPTAPAFS
jgi:hypothetical protein